MTCALASFSASAATLINTILLITDAIFIIPYVSFTRVNLIELRRVDFSSY